MSDDMNRQIASEPDKFAGHTPEPWERTGAVRLAIKGNGRMVAVIQRELDPATDYETHANGDLIAAAPRLLRENRELRAALYAIAEAKKTNKAGWQACALASRATARRALQGGGK